MDITKQELEQALIQKMTSDNTTQFKFKKGLLDTEHTVYVGYDNDDVIVTLLKKGTPILGKDDL